MGLLQSDFCTLAESEGIASFFTMTFSYGEPSLRRIPDLDASIHRCPTMILL